MADKPSPMMATILVAFLTAAITTIICLSVFREPRAPAGEAVSRSDHQPMPEVLQLPTAISSPTHPAAPETGAIDIKLKVLRDLVVPISKPITLMCQHHELPVLQELFGDQSQYEILNISEIKKVANGAATSSRGDLIPFKVVRLS